MIEITVGLARRIRAAVRSTLPLALSRDAPPQLLFAAGQDGLAVRWQYSEVAVEYRENESRPSDQVVVPSEASREIEGKSAETVNLEDLEGGRVRVSWKDRDLPRCKEFTLKDTTEFRPFPQIPTSWIDPGEGFLKALDEAGRTASRDAVRYALQRILLRGRQNQVAGTDGRQVLILGGFRLPWRDDVLVPAIPAFGSREIMEGGKVGLGRTETHVGLRVGMWTFLLLIDRHGRYPNIDSVIPAPSRSATTCRLDTQDLQRLARELPKLPGKEGRNGGAVTLTLNGVVAVRSRAEGDEPEESELRLDRSVSTGPPANLVCDRRFLAKVASLGFATLELPKVGGPLVCRDGIRTYAFMPMDTGTQPTRDEAPAASGSRAEIEDDNLRRVEPMAASEGGRPTNGRDDEHTPRGHAGNGHTPDSPNHQHEDSPLDLVSEAEGLRSLLLDAATRMGRLASALRQVRRQGRSVEGALAALRTLALGPPGRR